MRGLADIGQPALAIHKVNACAARRVADAVTVSGSSFKSIPRRVLSVVRVLHKKIGFE